MSITITYTTSKRDWRENSAVTLKKSTLCYSPDQTKINMKRMSVDHALLLSVTITFHHE